MQSRIERIIRLVGLFLAAAVMYCVLVSVRKTDHIHVAQFPEVTMPAAMEYVDTLPLDGVLVWDEQLVTAPWSGIVSYPSFSPRRVMKDEVMAEIDGEEVKAESAGYFMPALDGDEEDWIYRRLWLEMPELPQPKKLVVFDDGAYLHEGSPLGKFVPQPQELRCIAYLDKTASLMRRIEDGFIEIKEQEDSKTRYAKVRACLDTGTKVKVYLTLPFFPASTIMTHAFSCSVLTGKRHGVSVPSSAVFERDGNLNVLQPSMMEFTEAEFTEVEGFPIEWDRFFIADGIDPSDIVFLYPDKIRDLQSLAEEHDEIRDLQSLAEEHDES